MSNRTSRSLSNRQGLHSNLTSSVLVCLLVAAPFQAFGQQRPVMGSISAVGTVQLRGVPISRVGTLFDGDRIETSGDAYVRVQLTGGSQLELGDDTAVEVNFDELSVQIEMSRGTVAFSSREATRPISVSIESLRIDGTEGAVAEVAFLAPNRLSVTALSESLTLTQAAEGQETEPVAEGEQVIIDLDAGIESTEAPPTPAVAAGPAGDSSSKWVLIGAGVGGGAGAGIFLATKGNSSASQSQP